jgi:L-2-hydroxyglutarate oxidase LhgO
MNEEVKALDPETERTISAIVTLLAGHIKPVPSDHRLANKRDADVVQYLKERRVAAADTFEEILDLFRQFGRQAELLGFLGKDLTMNRTADLVVIGGGVVGLALARSWLLREPQAHVVVLEKETELAAHASGRNSGVLHAGFYYAPDSLKARLTRDGNRQLRAFCVEHGVPVLDTGKVVVATAEDRLDALDELARRGLANGVEIEMVDEAALREIEPMARTVTRALWSPTTAVADPAGVVRALADDVRGRGGRIELGSRAISGEQGWVMTSTAGRISTGHIINAAGLYADSVAHWFGVGEEYRMLPFKGLYWYSNWEPGRLKRHIYPVPDPRNPFLGVHLTVTVDGRAKVGPTAIPALWREDYGGLANFSPGELMQIVGLYPRFLASPHHHVPALIRSELPKYWRRHLVREAAALAPAIRTHDFRTRGRVGVRAQLLHVPSGRLELDFVVRSGDRSTHILNAVSPAWTSALAVGDHVVNGILSGPGRSAEVRDGLAP